MKKTLIGLAVVVIAAAAGGTLWLRSNLDGLVKAAIETYGSEMTQAKVSVGSVEIRAADGQGIIRGLVIGNPAGFKTPHAFKVAEIDVQIDPASLVRDVVVIRRIAVSAPDVIYEKGERMTNFDAIERNIAGYLGPQQKTGKKDDGKKLLVEQLTIRDAKAQASAAFMDGRTLSVPLPDISLRDIGKAKGGVPPGELGKTVVDALKARLSNAISFDRLMKSAGQTVESATQAVKDLFKK